MANLKSIVRKGRIYSVTVAETEYRAFIWQNGKNFSGRVEDHPQVQLCHGPSVVVVRERLRVALSASLAA
ncbi:hypothetical protein HC891_24860 [Candidatus Gracilibacteria bacterium]|nr:hypothetical protein [Candidatus Gracilibacteria bacterium]